MARPLRALCAVLLAFGLFGCDHATKAVATRSLARAVSIEPGILELHYVQNDDVAFNVFQRLGVPHSPLFLTAVMILALAVSVAFFVGQRRTASQLDLVAAACIVGVPSGTSSIASPAVSSSISSTSAAGRSSTSRTSPSSWASGCSPSGE